MQSSSIVAPSSTITPFKETFFADLDPVERQDRCVEFRPCADEAIAAYGGVTGHLGVCGDGAPGSDRPCPA